MYENVLVPTDGSDSAELAIERGLELAETYGATVHALYVVEPVYTAEYSGERIINALEDEGKRATAAIAAQGDERCVPVETEVRRGPPHREILDYADVRDVDLVVMGTHGRTSVERYLLGSVTEKVVRLSDVPVLTVRTTDEQ
ncbi:universal stress protein [Halorussus salinisoli]|uniref:universal stress protein n=1 Tax=Halorussus salinisoli TaxID=2558242 RepID=UPI0010C212A1|nr:universal stress protein [Halorussus salinisoli]